MLNMDKFTKNMVRVTYFYVFLILRRGMFFVFPVKSFYTDLGAFDSLTPTKLILAMDILPSADFTAVYCYKGVDPLIETLELIAVYPIESVNLSIFRRRRRQTLKAHFCNNTIRYYELSGFEKRKMFWNLWCERVRFLNPEDRGSSNQETSVASSTSNSTLYLLESSQTVSSDGRPQLWCRFGAGDCNDGSVQLKVGSPLQKSSINHIAATTAVSETRKKVHKRYKDTSAELFNSRNSEMKDSHRHDGGLNDGTFIPAEDDFILKRNFSENSCESAEMFNLSGVHTLVLNLPELAESSVKLWENVNMRKKYAGHRGRHPRRYGLSPHSHFLNGLGPWSVNPGEKYSIQVKRAVSLVSIRKQPAETELRLPVSKRQLTASISCEVLSTNCSKATHNYLDSLKTPCSPVIYFWTPEYWYRPRSAREAYKELQEHLRKINTCHSAAKVTNNKNKKKTSKKKEKQRQQVKHFEENSEDSYEEFSSIVKYPGILRVGHLKVCVCCPGSRKDKSRNLQQSSLQYIRKALRLEVTLSAWDFDSNTMAYQLTMINKDLLLKIPSVELGVIVWQQTSKNAPNIAAMIAFSHRISCLIASEILKNGTVDARGRLIVRIINTADKCHKISNFQSCKTILCGLQTPPIYRLYGTWSYIRQKHATKYQTFENLCRLYRDPRLPIYQKAFYNASRNPPYLINIFDLLVRLLNRVSSTKLDFQEPTAKGSSLYFIKGHFSKTDSSDSKLRIKSKSSPNFVCKLLSALKIWPVPSENSVPKISEKPQSTIESHEKFSKKDIEFREVVVCYEDRRVEKLEEVTDLLEECKRAAEKYDFSKNMLAQEYLLKARYKEDRENFFYSFNLESKDVIDK